MTTPHRLHFVALYDPHGFARRPGFVSAIVAPARRIPQAGEGCLPRCHLKAAVANKGRKPKSQVS